MKKTFIFFTGLFFLFCATSAFAVTLGWDDPNPVNAGITEYRINWFETANPANNGSATVYGYQNTIGTISNDHFFWNVQYAFTVTAVNAGQSLESDPSDPLMGYMDQAFIWIVGAPPGGGGGIILAPPGGLFFSAEDGTPASNVTTSY